MSIESCIVSAKKWVKENSDVELSARELQQVGQLLSKAEELGASPAEKNRLMSEMVNQKLEMVQTKNRARAYINAIKNEEIVGNVLQNAKTWADQGMDKNQAPIEARKAFIAGGATRTGGIGTNLDPQYMAATTRVRYLNFFENAFSPEDLKVLKTSPMTSQMSSDIVQELYAMRKGQQLGQSGNDIALRIARGIRETQDYTLNEARALNPYAGENPDYLFSREHSRDKISATPKEDWIKDAKRTFAPSFLGRTAEETHALLADTYDDIKSGLHGDSFDPRSFWEPKGTAGNQGAAVAGSRSFTATDWKAEVEYARKYGADSLYTSTYDQLNRTARNTARFQKMGLDIADNYRAQEKAILKQLDPDQKEAWVKASPEMKKLFESTMGFQDNEAWGMRARAAQGLLVAEDLSQMGMHTPRSLSGVQAGITLARDAFGKTLPENAFEITSGMAQQVLTKNGGRDALKAMSVAFRDMARDAIGDLAGGNKDFSLPARAAQAMGRISLANREAAAMKAALCKFTTAELGAHSSMPFEELPLELQRRLNRASLGGDTWEVLRQSTEKDGAMQGSILPESALRLTDEQVKPLMQTDNPREATRIRTEMAMNYGALLNDEAGLMVGESNSKTRYAAYGDTNLNTSWGIARRFMMQFRQSAATRQQLLQRTLYSGGGATSNVGGVFQHMLGTALLGTIGEGLVSLAVGKTLPSPNSPEVIGHMVNSTGLLGIYGSLLASFLEGPHYNPTEAVKGAALSAIGPASKTLLTGIAAAGKTGLGIAQALQGEESEGQYGGKYWASLIHGLVPGQNLFYTKAALDYILMNEINEFMGGGGNLESLRQQTEKTPAWPEALGGPGGQQQYTFGGKNFWE